MRSNLVEISIQVKNLSQTVGLSTREGNEGCERGPREPNYPEGPTHLHQTLPIPDVQSVLRSLDFFSNTLFDLTKLDFWITWVSAEM